MFVIREAQTSQVLLRDKGLHREASSFSLCFLWDLLCHRVEFPTWLLLDKAGLYFFSWLLNTLETEFPHPPYRNYLTRCYKN